MLSLTRFSRPLNHDGKSIDLKEMFARIIAGHATVISQKEGNLYFGCEIFLVSFLKTTTKKFLVTASKRLVGAEPISLDDLSPEDRERLRAFYQGCLEVAQELASIEGVISPF